MIEIKVNDVIYPSNPMDVCIKRSQYDMFIEGFKQLCEATGMHAIKIGSVGISGITIPTQLNFDNGEVIGIKRLFEELGFNMS